MNGLERDGYCIIANVISAAQVTDTLEDLHRLVVVGAGTRNLLELPWCQSLARQLRQHPFIAPALSPNAISVQCTYFEKGKGRNWLVSPHQDLSIPVKDRIEDSRLTRWSQKEGQIFVHAPDPLLQQLLAVRLHLDGCTADNGPLRVVPGSHWYGRLSEAQSKQIRATSQEIECVLSAGDVLLMRPLILHASSKAAVPGHRRVLHFLYGPESPGYNLRWQFAV